MGRNRRQQRLQQRRRERTERPPTTDGTSAGAEGRGAAPPPRPRGKPAWRQTIDQWGGLPMIGGVVVVLVVLGVLVWQNLPGSTSVSDAPLMGDEVPMTSAAHITDPAVMDIQPGLPPAGGPHFQQFLGTGVYDEPQQDGFVVHALEHGVIWFSYNPDLIDPADLETVIDVANRHSRDTIVSPRLDNSAPLYALSWGRRLEVPTPVDPELLREFIQTNVNRAPEPGVR